MLAKLVKQIGPRCTVHIKATATAHRLATHNSFLCAAKPSKWIVDLLQLSHPTFIIISVILTLRSIAEALELLNVSGHNML